MNESVAVLVRVSADGKTVSARVPYNPSFNNQARNLQGKFDRATGAWVFDVRDEGNVRRLCFNVFGSSGEAGVAAETVTLRVTVSEEWQRFTAPLMLAGRPVASASGRDSGARLGAGVVILEGGARSGGSVKNWTTKIPAGTVFEMRDVPVAAAEKSQVDPPSGLEIEIVRTEVPDAATARRARIEALRAELASLEAEEAGA